MVINVESCVPPVVVFPALMFSEFADIVKSLPNDKMPADATDGKLQNPEKE